MLSLNLPRTYFDDHPTPFAANAAGAQEARPAQEGGLKSAGTMPKSHPGRNAGKPENRRFRTVFAPE
jgi:hypothetical protein